MARGGPPLFCNSWEASSWRAANAASVSKTPWPVGMGDVLYPLQRVARLANVTSVRRPESSGPSSKFGWTTKKLQKLRICRRPTYAFPPQTQRCNSIRLRKVSRSYMYEQFLDRMDRSNGLLRCVFLSDSESQGGQISFLRIGKVWLRATYFRIIAVWTALTTSFALPTPLDRYFNFFESAGNAFLSLTVPNASLNFRH